MKWNITKIKCIVRRRNLNAKKNDGCRGGASPLGRYYNYFRRSKGFTLAELLISLTVIGVVAVFTIPVLISNINDIVYKIAYKQAYSDINQSFQMLAANNEILYQLVWEPAIVGGEPTPGFSKLYGENFKIIALYMKSIKTCFDKLEGDNCFKCKNTEYGDFYSTAEDNWISNSVCKGNYSFIDYKGRNWMMYSNRERVFVVDTNGFKGPNQLGKDRFPFAMVVNNQNINNYGNKATPNTIKPNFAVDLTTKQRWCPSGKCYYKSWLYSR